VKWGRAVPVSDEQVVRLESDADLVKVITIHKSKGLEYPLVCLPLAAEFRERDERLTRFVTLPDEQGARQLRLDVSAAGFGPGRPGPPA